jgi:F0F1-type ATP synthase assembly protein I
MMTQEAVYHAIAFDGLREQPLTIEQREGRRPPSLVERKVLSSSFKSSSLLVGLMIGFLIQLSTLGANFTVVYWTGGELFGNSDRDVILFSLTWSLFTSSLAVGTMFLVRSLVSAVYADSSEEEEEGDGDRLERIVMHLEARFVAGAMTGVCATWIATDAVLGLTTQLLLSLVIVGVSVGWCCLMIRRLTIEEEGEEEERQRKKKGTELPPMLI